MAPAAAADIVRKVRRAVTMAAILNVRRACVDTLRTGEPLDLGRVPA